MSSLYSKISKEILKNFKERPLRLHEPIFSLKEKKYLKKCIDSGFVSSSKNGSFIKKFEKKIKNFTKSKYAISTINGVSGLHASLIALGINKNDEVFLPSLTFVATAHPVIYLGAIPHFVEIDPNNLGICPSKLEKYLKKIAKKKGSFFINKKTKRRLKAIVAVHVFGHPCEVHKLKKIANRYNMKLVEDATEALGSFYKRKHVGNFGDAGVFSFNGNKIITTGGGGVIITNKKRIAEKISHLVSNAKIPHPWEYIHRGLGFNYRMPNLNAALGVAQFEKLKTVINVKKKIYGRYKKIFKKFSDFKLLNQPKNCKSNFWLNAIQIDNKKIKKNKLINFFYKKGIHSRPVWKPLHTLSHLKNYPKMNLNLTNSLYKKLINLPSGPGII